MMRDLGRLFISVAHKLSVRGYVEQTIGERHLVPLLYSGESIDPETLLELGDDIVVKRNNDSGSVSIIRDNFQRLPQSICKEINRDANYSLTTNEWWNSGIEQRVIVEPLLVGSEVDSLPCDIKLFFCSKIENCLLYTSPSPRD